jgi:hypothetical protein
MLLLKNNVPINFECAYSRYFYITLFTLSLICGDTYPKLFMTTSKTLNNS